MRFNSNIHDLGAFKSDWPQDIIKNEPMLFNCDYDYAFQYGGSITRDFLALLPSDWFESDVVIDSKVHMLMPNWYPCIPGYHHDDVPRSTSTGQPNYKNPEYHADHLMGLVNGDICPTQFIIGNVEVSEPDVNGQIYNRWNSEIEAQPDLVRYSAESGKYLQFDSNAFHTGIKARAGGWRWFIRLSRNTVRTKHITNEIRRQVQVYLDDPMMGW
jgi:hypothetical protein